MNHRDWLGEHPRIKQALGVAATLLAAGASVATSVGSDFCKLTSLDQHIHLSADHPEVRRRFLVESSEAKLKVGLRFATTTPARTSFELRVNSVEVQLVPYPDNIEAGTAESRMAGHIEADCANGFPCVALLEVTATAKDLTPAGVDADLSVSVEHYDCLNPENDLYLSIEPGLSLH